MNGKHITVPTSSYSKMHCIVITLFSLIFVPFFAGADENIIRAGGNRAHPPFEFLDETGQPAGFAIDLTQAVAQTMGFAVNLELSSCTEAQARLEYGIVDILASMYRSPSRQGTIDFSQPYYTTDYRLFTHKESGIQGLQDISSLRIATLADEPVQEFLIARGLASNIIILNDPNDLFQSLVDNKADCAVFAATDGQRIIKRAAFSTLTALPAPLFSAEYCMVVRKGNDSLLASINEGISILKANGKYDRLYQRWFGTSEKNIDDTASGIIAALIAVLTTVSAVLLTRLKTSRQPARLSADERSEALKRRAELDVKLQDALSLPEDPIEPEPVAQPIKARVVVAEDEAINRMYLKRLLEKAGYEVRAAVDGQAALEAASERTWDFILMDVSMPRMDGLEATRRIRALEAERNSPHIPIIALTAHAYAEDREACTQAGMDGFLPKPFTEPALWEEVSRIAENRIAPSPPGR